MGTKLCKVCGLEKENGRLTKRIEALEELCKDGDLYKVKALDINYGIIPECNPDNSSVIVKQLFFERYGNDR